MKKILRTSSSDKIKNNEHSEKNKEYNHLPEFNVLKIFTQSSNRTMKLDNSENDTQMYIMNPNEAEFQKYDKKKYMREKSVIIPHEAQFKDSQSSSSCEEFDIDDDSSSSPTLSDDLLDPKFLTPTNNKFQLNDQSNDRQKEFHYEKPVGYGLLSLPNGNIIEYEIPKSEKRAISPIKRLDSMNSNIALTAQKDDSKYQSLKRNESDSREKSEILSRNYNNGLLCSIKEDHVEENSASDLIIDKPIRSLRDIYNGIRKDIKEHKRAKIKKKAAKCIEESKQEESEMMDSENLDLSCEEEDVEMNSSQKKILEDKVIKMITFWNDMDYIKNNSESFISSDKKKNNKEEIKATENIFNNSETINPDNLSNQNNSASRAKHKNRLLKTASKINKKKKIILDEPKIAKSPLAAPQEQRQSNIILFNSSYFDPSKNSSNEEIFLFSDKKRECKFRKITFNEKMRKLKMFSDIKSKYQLQKGNSNKLTKAHTQNRGVINKTFILEKRRMTTAQKYGNKGFNDSKSSLPSASSMIYQNSFYKSNVSNYRGNQFPSKDTNNYSYQSNNSHSAKRRKRDRNEEI